MKKIVTWLLTTGPDEVDEDQLKLLYIELLIAIPLVIDAVIRNAELGRMLCR